MKYTQYLIYEVCKGCNLGKVHSLCPNLHEDRFSHIASGRPVPDATIVDIARRMYGEFGFRGRVGWHYYNEPLMAETRLWRLMDAIDAAVPTVEYTLWTNGTRWPKSPENLTRFAEVHLTDYRLPKFPVDLAAWRELVPHVQIQHWPLDNRIDAFSEPNTRPCRRMFTEWVVDFHGNVHLCCYDWRGVGSPGNVITHDLEELVKRWREIREQISGPAMLPDAPHVCMTCGMRSDFIPRFMPNISDDAKRYAQGL